MVCGWSQTAVIGLFARKHESVASPAWKVGGVDVSAAALAD